MLTEVIDIPDSARLKSLSTAFNVRQLNAFSGVGLNTLGDLSEYMVRHTPKEMIIINDIADQAIYMSMMLLQDHNLPYMKDYDNWVNNEFSKSIKNRACITKISKRRKQAEDNGVPFTYARGGHMEGRKKTALDEDLEKIRLEKSENLIKHYYTNGYNPIASSIFVGYSKDIKYPEASALLSTHREKLKTAGIYNRIMRELGLEQDDLRDRALAALNDSMNAVKYEFRIDSEYRDQEEELKKIAPDLTNKQISAILKKKFVIGSLKYTAEVPDHKIRNEAVKVMSSMFPKLKSEESLTKAPKNAEDALETLIDQTERMLKALKTEIPEVVEDYIEKLRERFAA